MEEKLLAHEELKEEVPLSLIIPTYNCAEVIGTTLESVASQEYEALEVIVVDAGSKDRTLEIVNSYASLITRVYSVARFNLADMINRGVALASNRYLTTLFPGSYYLSDAAYQTFALAAEQNSFPDVIYCGSIQREVKREPKFFHYSFDIELIKKGQHPATLPACWFKRSLFDKVGKFNALLTVRPGYEFFCRLICEQNLTIQMIERVLVDFDYGRFSYGKMLRFAAETWRILSWHFGIWTAFRWFLSIDHIVMFKWVWGSFKKSLAHR